MRLDKYLKVTRLIKRRTIANEACDAGKVLVKRKFLVQIGGAMAFVIVFGLISLLLDLPIKVFFIVCGVVVGVINGMAVTLMYSD